MTDEERQRTMDFILAQQAQFSADMQRLEESQKRAEARHQIAEAMLDTGSYKIDRLERIMKLVIEAGLRIRRENRERDQEWNRRFAELREANAHSDRRLNALIDVVREQRNGAT